MQYINCCHFLVLECLYLSRMPTTESCVMVRSIVPTHSNVQSVVSDPILFFSMLSSAAKVLYGQSNLHLPISSHKCFFI